MKIVKVVEKEEWVEKQKFHYKLPAALWENKEALTQQRPFQSPSLTPLHLHTLTMRNTFFIVYYRRPPSKNNIFSLKGRSWQTSPFFKHWIHLGMLRDGGLFPYSTLPFSHNPVPFRTQSRLQYVQCVTCKHLLVDYGQGQEAQTIL